MLHFLCDSLILNLKVRLEGYRGAARWRERGGANTSARLEEEQILCEAF